MPIFPLFPWDFAASGVGCARGSFCRSGISCPGVCARGAGGGAAKIPDLRGAMTLVRPLLSALAVHHRIFLARFGDIQT
jgi:hypothetical protein